MRLLFYTQKLDCDDSLVGFTHNWVNEIAGHVQKLIVITSFSGRYDLPSNVTVHSLGKEKGNGGLKRLFRLYAIVIPLILKRQVDAVFSHMIPQFVIAVYPFARLANIPVYLWYAHRFLHPFTRVCIPICEKIFTSHKNSFRTNTGRLVILGQGIDSNLFLPKKTKQNRRILCAGRISKIKDQETLIKACSILKKRRIDFELVFAGGPTNKKDEMYYKRLKSLVNQLNIKDCTKFLGHVNFTGIPDVYNSSFLIVNLSPTGLFDKVLLEAMMCAVPAIVCNESFSETLGKYKRELLFQYKDENDLAEKIVAIFNKKPDELEQMREYVRANVLREHSLNKLAQSLISTIR